MAGFCEDRATREFLQTPTFYINGKPLTQYSFEQLRAHIREEVAAQYR